MCELQVLETDEDESDDDEDDSGSEGPAAEVSLTASSMSNRLAWRHAPCQLCTFWLHLPPQMLRMAH
jgi:hypothetical protein